MLAHAEPVVPFRWDLIAPDHLGTLLDGVEAPHLWFAGRLVECAGKVIARSGGDLFFVGRSLDSMFDLLGGACRARPQTQHSQGFGRRDGRRPGDR